MAVKTTNPRPLRRPRAQAPHRLLRCRPRTAAELRPCRGTPKAPSQTQAAPPHPSTRAAFRPKGGTWAPFNQPLQQVGKGARGVPGKYNKFGSIVNKPFIILLMIAGCFLLAANDKRGAHQGFHREPAMRRPNSFGQVPHEVLIDAVVRSRLAPPRPPSPPCQKKASMLSGGCVARRASKIPSRPFVFTSERGRCSRRQVLRRWRSVQAKRPNSTSKLFRTCCVMPAGSPWPTRANAIRPRSAWF